MTIDEAIEKLADVAYGAKLTLSVELIDAMRLAIEALNEIMRFRNGKYTRDLWRLKGETEEPKSTFPFYRKGGAVNSLGKVYQTTQGSQYPLVNDETDEIYRP